LQLKAILLAEMIRMKNKTLELMEELIGVWLKRKRMCGQIG